MVANLSASMLRAAAIAACLFSVVHGRRRALSPAQESRNSQATRSQRSTKALESLLFALNPSGSVAAKNRALPSRSSAAPVQSQLRQSHQDRSTKLQEPHAPVAAFANSIAAVLAAALSVSPSGASAEDAAAKIAEEVVIPKGITEEAFKVMNGEELSWFETYVKGVQDGIGVVHDFLAGIGFPYPYATCIFLIVLLAKTITFPLNYKQYEGTAAMRATQPQRDLIQKWYVDDQREMNIQLGSIFDEIDINPLASIVPVFFQIPILLGVYYGVTSIAKAEIYTEGFLWIPSLIGPISDRTEGIAWLTDGRFGSSEILAYLTLPAMLVATQYVSLYALGSFDAIKESEKNGGGSPASKIIYVLPWFLGWVAMNAPSALGLYWLFSNVFTTAITNFVKTATKMDELIPDINFAEVGPRRDPLPLVNKDWSLGVRPPTEKPETEGTEKEASTAPPVAPA
mmetsp:Transcript_101463/g.160435  ORF Transcript_101463/g.160435 Transcript_101463/m.160435 type:complete len:456 (-) Transcript_101463:459-1826(-)